jgi:glycosyltransferase involved in cell wall biosynthesis
MVNILFNGHDFKFLQYLIDYYLQRQDFRVIMDHTGGHTIADKKKSTGLLKDADLIFCEWALGNAEWYSHNKLPGQKLVIRLHLQEMTLRYLDNMKWENVDQIVFICEENMEVFLQRFPFMVEYTSLIYNLIDCEKLNVQKLPDACFNLGFIGLAPKRKAPHLAIEIFRRLKKTDDRYILYFKGKNPLEYEWLRARAEENAYYLDFYKEVNASDLVDSIVFDDFGDDMPAWFSKISFILSTSDFEGSHQAVAEGMASGTLPVIRNWAGADRLYPDQFVVQSAEKAVELILSFQDEMRFQNQVEFVKQYAGTHFDIPVIVAKYNNLFSRLLNNPEINIPVSRVHEVSESPEISLSVAFVCFLSPGSQNGYEIRVVEEAKVLLKQGVKVYIAVFVSADKVKEVSEQESFRHHLETITGAVVFVYPTSRFFDLHISDRLLQEIDRPLTDLAGKYQISIFHGQALYASFHAARVARSLGGRVVFDNHGILPEETMMRGGNPNWIKTLSDTEHQLLRDADLCIMVSDGMRKFLEQKYSVKTKLTQIVPCCVHMDVYQNDPANRENIRRQRKFDGKFVVLYLGTLSVWQWPEAMFRLFAQLHEAIPETIFHLLIPEYDQEKARQFILLNNLPADCVVMEEVPHAQVPKMINAADAGILLREQHPVNVVSSPTKFGEYLAAGIPVILTDGIGDYSELAERLNVGVKINYEKGGFSEVTCQKLVHFVKDVQRNRAVWTERCQSAAAGNLDWDLYGRKIMEQYKNMIAK